MRTRRLGLFAALSTVMLAATVACSSGGAPPSNAGQESTSAAVAAPSSETGSAAASSGAETTAAPSSADGPAPAFAGSEVKMEDPTDAGEPKKGGTLRFLARLDADKLDPHVATDTTGIITGALVYEGLVENDRGEIKPALAEEWEISEDGLTYTFTLREANFHSGRAMTSADVKYSLERVMNPDTLAPNSNSYKGITAIETPDDRTVVLTLEAPHAPMLFLLSSLSASVVDRDVVESTGLAAAPDGGTGPFKLVAHNVGQNLQLEANRDYWNPELPHVDGIDITFNPDDNARAAALRSNSVDVLFRPAPEFIDALKADETVKWYGGSGSLSLHLLLNASKAPYDNEKVRQAIFLALDRQELLDVANSGHGVPLNAGYLPPDRWGSVNEPIYSTPKVEEAKALLAEAGYPDGFDAEIMVIGTSAFQVRQAEVEQAQLAAIGITVTIKPVDAQVSTQELKAGNFDMYQSGFGLRADPDERFSAAFTTGGGLNYSKFSDPEFDELIIAARSELDRDTREGLYEQADRILAERGPAAFTILTADYDAVAANVNGYRGDSTPNFSIYKYLWIDS